MSDPEALFKTHSPDYKAKFRERLLAASKALTMWDVEATLVTPDGRKKYTHAIARPTRQHDGSVLWTGVILDETRTREAIIDSLSQGFLLYDAQDRLIMRNSHYLKLYPALHDVAVPGATYEEVVKGENRHGTRQACARASTARRNSASASSSTRTRTTCSSGSSTTIAGSSSMSSAPRDGGTVVLYTDISELKQREKQIRHLAYHDIADRPSQPRAVPSAHRSGACRARAGAGRPSRSCASTSTTSRT